METHMKKTDSEAFERPILTVDVVLLTIHEGRLQVALSKRGADPFKGREALVGGFIHVGEDRDAEACAARVLKEKAGLREVYIEQLATFSGADRDPRGWSASIAYIALVPFERLKPAVGEGVALVPVDETRGLPFDHDRILTEALRRVRGKGAYSTLPTQLLGKTFTMSALLEVYETVMGVRLDQSSFRRKFAELDLIEEAGEERKPGRRPATVYRLKGKVSTFDRKL